MAYHPQRRWGERRKGGPGGLGGGEGVLQYVVVIDARLPTSRVTQQAVTQNDGFWLGAIGATLSALCNAKIVCAQWC